jgi:hypothetical protein
MATHEPIIHPLPAQERVVCIIPFVDRVLAIVDRSIVTENSAITVGLDGQTRRGFGHRS